MDSQPAIRVRNLTKIYGGGRSKSIRALDDVSLTINRGEVFGLLGPNGAGKTTLLKILLGLVAQTDGSASIAGVDASNHRARRIIGFLPENHRFPGFLTGEQMLIHYGSMSGIDVKTVTSRIPDLLERVKMDQWADTRLKKYSKGMMQRIGLAQSLINDPEIIFLDEPTDGVDPVGRREIRTILTGLSAEGKTIFLNSHLLSEVEQICTRVAILNEGRLAAEGTVDDLTAGSSASAYRIVVDPDGNPLPASVGTTQPAERDGLVRLIPELSDRTDLNRFLDELRHRGILVESVTPLRRTLEDSFIDLLDKPADLE